LPSSSWKRLNSAIFRLFSVGLTLEIFLPTPLHIEPSEQRLQEISNAKKIQIQRPQVRILREVKFLQCLFLAAVVLIALLACLHDQNKSNFFGVPTFFQPTELFK